MELKMMINFLNREAEDHLDNPEIIGMYDAIIRALKERKVRKVLIKINTMLDMREILKLKGDIMKSADEGIKIYKPELDILRIDIKELKEDEK